MNRKWMIWLVLPVLVGLLTGCPKKKPATNNDSLQVDTQPMATPTPAPAVDVQATPAPAVQDQTEDALMSEDMQVVNDELHRRGFSADIYFQYDEASLSDEARQQLARNADLLKSQPQFAVTIEGHADSRGTNEYNLALGEKRANAVRDYLGSLGVGPERLRTLSYGEERPVCTTEEESCWSQNRRAHMIVTGRSNVG
jgi:peptidoglycan-associated lipoprotein